MPVPEFVCFSRQDGAGREKGKLAKQMSLPIHSLSPFLSLAVHKEEKKNVLDLLWTEKKNPMVARWEAKTVCFTGEGNPSVALYNSVYCISPSW